MQHRADGVARGENDVEEGAAGAATMGSMRALVTMISTTQARHDPRIAPSFAEARSCVKTPFLPSRGLGQFADTARHAAIPATPKIFRDFATLAGERPHLMVTVGVQTLKGLAGAAELDHVGAIDPEAARRLACDASVTRVVMAGPSEPLEVGRNTPVVPPALRKAVWVRDQRCRFPGCRRPQAWCDAHHIRHWADGGETALSNLLLLCRPHHRLLHEGGFGLQTVDGRPVFRRPDGSIIEDGRAQP
jgi:hypothetical protein